MSGVFSRSRLSYSMFREYMSEAHEFVFLVFYRGINQYSRYKYWKYQMSHPPNAPAVQTDSIS
jgi:hypothetical protein